MPAASLKKARGRPQISEGGSTQVAIRIPNVMLEMIDDISRDRLDSPDRAVVIRELLAEALEGRRKKR